MAGFTLSGRQEWFPIGTTVGAFLPSQRRPYLNPGPAVAPEGAAVESQAVSAGGVAAFIALAALTRYVLYAQVGGEHRYLQITSGA